MKIWRIMPWWWKGLLLLNVLILAIISFSFFRITAWMSPRSGYYVYVEHGMVCGNRNLGLKRPPAIPFGSFELFQSGVYEPWRFLPDVWLDGPLAPGFKFPIHIVVGAIAIILIYSGVRIARAARRGVMGLCRTCQYDLRGNVSGVCPECGRQVDARGNTV